MEPPGDESYLKAHHSLIRYSPFPIRYPLHLPRKGQVQKPCVIDIRLPQVCGTLSLGFARDMREE